MKKILFCLLAIFIIALVYIQYSKIYTQNSEIPNANFYKNILANEVLSKNEFEEFKEKLYLKYIDTTRGKLNIMFHFSKLVISNDSIIQPFNYDVRLGDEYLVRANSYDKIRMKIPVQKFLTISGDSIYIGGKQKKPILINLWFIGCRGCIQEIPALNKLREEYKDKVDFVAMTFDSKEDVLTFLKKKEFNFNHIANSESFIKQIGTKPYPENIFINKDGSIEYIEGGLGDLKNGDDIIEHFESILKKLLK